MNLQQLGDALGLEYVGDAKHTIDAMAPIERARSNELSFVVGPRYRSQLQSSRAGAVIVPVQLRGDAPGNVLISANPYASYARASVLLYPDASPESGIHSSATIDSDACVSASASIGAHAVVGRGCVIGEGVIVSAHCVLGERVQVGAGTRLFARVTLCNDVTLGKQCRIQSGAVIGAEGFGYAWDNDGWVPIQQIGGVQIGDCVHVGANTTIDCGAIDPTVIGNGVIIDNQVQIAHNVRIGEHTAIAGCVGIAGSTRIGKHCQIGGACNIVGHITIVDSVVLNAASLISRSIKVKGRYGSGGPLMNESAWRRYMINLTRLDKLMKRVSWLERVVEKHKLAGQGQLPNDVSLDK